MTEDFKKWLHIKANDVWSHIGNEYEILFKAMWAINRKWNDNFQSGWHIKPNDELTGYVAMMTIDGVFQNSRYFFFIDHHNSEQEALKKALEYIMKQETK